MSVRHGDNTTIATPFSVLAQGGGADIRIGTYAPQIHIHIHVSTAGEAEPLLGWFEKLTQRLFGRNRGTEVVMTPEEAVKYLRGETIPMPLPGEELRGL